MARIFIDCFAHGVLLGHWVITEGTPAIVAAKNGMSGGYCLELLSSESVQLDLGQDYSELYVAFKYYPNSITGSYEFHVASFYNASGQVLGGLNRYSQTGKFYLHRNETTVLASSGKDIFGSRTYLAEVYFKPKTDATGAAKLKVNGKLEIDFTGQTSNYAGGIRYIRLGHMSAPGRYADAYFGDVVADDGVWPGNTVMALLKPQAAGSSTQWTPSAGANWDCVEEVPASMNEFVGVNAGDQLDLYTLTDLPAAPDAVKCVQLQAMAAKYGSPTPGNLQLALRTANTNYFSGDKTPPAIISKHLFHIWENNPNTLAAWTKTQLDGLEAGIKSVT
jgi:hypothetical protein